jgi:hypothetical protein
MAIRRGQRSVGFGSRDRRAPRQELVLEGGECGTVGLPPRPNHHIHRRQRSHELPAPLLPEPARLTIAGHRGGLELRYDQSHPRMARLVVDPQHLEMVQPPPPSVLLHSVKLRGTSQPARARKTLVRRQRPPCFEGIFTVRRLRPFFLRRESTSRPQRSAIRARKPCRLTRFRLRGR